MSSKIWIVVQREFTTYVKKKSFIIMTILAPFLMAALIFLPLALSFIKDSDRQTVAVIDETGLYSEIFKSDKKYLFVPTEKMTASFRSDSTDVDAVIQITANFVDHPTRAAIFSQKEVPSDLRTLVENTLTEKVRKQKFERYNIPELNSIVDDMQKSIEVATIRWTDEGEQESISEIATVMGMVLTFLIYMFVLSYGSMVMQGVMEEKTNRIVELIVSSIKPIELLLGKIIGIGLVGLFQMLIWGLLLTIITGVAGILIGIPMGSAVDASLVSNPSVDTDALKIISALSSLPILEIGILFIVYFIGGYLLYASVLAALGSAVNDPQDSGQLMMPVMILMMFAFYAGFYSSQNPEGPLAFWCSFIPFTSPLVMMVRVPFGVPIYQVIISLFMLFGFTGFLLWVSSKIYRVGILIHGKKPSFKDIYKWLKY